MKRFWTILFTAAVLIGLAGCASQDELILPMPENARLIDVRSENEFNAGHLKGAQLIPHTEIGKKIQSIAPDKDTPLYLYCRSGRRVGIAIDALKKLGYKKLYNLGGMEEARQKTDLPIVK